MDIQFASRGGAGGGCVGSYAGGGRCVGSRYPGGGGGLYDISMVNRMMMKFRPIAPKPIASGSGSGDSTAENGVVGKRKYVKVKGNSRKNKKSKVSTSSFQASGGDAVVTLSLLPETPDRKENSPAVSSQTSHVKISSSPVWLSFQNNIINNQTSREAHVKIEQQKTVLTWVKVEGVVEACVEKGWMGMESDTCPGFISDREDRVVWMNNAYREMAAGGAGEEVVVVLARNKEGISYYPAAFTCNVRVTCRSGMNSSTLTVPCDAWRMEGGGYAWRLDVKAALSLGR